MGPESVNKTIDTSLAVPRWRDYVALGKMRLTTFVVISAIMGYFIAGEPVNWAVLVAMVVGGFLITVSSNAFNQLIEVEQDGQMKRTADRPFPTQRLQKSEGVIFSTIVGVLGLVILFWGAGSMTGWLGLLSLVMYVAMYTPMKKISPWAVFVGAFPGAMPPLLGYVAAKGVFDFNAGILFAVQFAWQFPHFWAIAWKLHDDYSKVGYRMLPFGRKDGTTGGVILASALVVIPLSMLPILAGLGNWISMVVVVMVGFYQAYQAFQLYRYQTDKHALKLMFATFLYLPLILIMYML